MVWVCHCLISELVQASNCLIGELVQASHCLISELVQASHCLTYESQRKVTHVHAMVFLVLTWCCVVNGFQYFTVL